ncbi:MAG: TIGR04086 family membrane protein [Bacilli bacterium]|nr:TIGR04086 family membrane protein [Bacilli bacterium]
MTTIKKYLKYLLFTTLSILILLFLITIPFYFDLININTYNFFKLLIVIFPILINSLLLGRESKKKRYLTGLRFGLLITILLLVLTLIFSKFELKNIIYYLIIIATSTLGSMFGITKRT